jgi:hypothetical protein
MGKSKHRSTPQPINFLPPLRPAVKDLRELFEGKRGHGMDVVLAESVRKIAAVYSAVLSVNNPDRERLAGELGNPSEDDCSFFRRELEGLVGAVFRSDRKAVEAIVSALDARSFLTTLEDRVELSVGEVRDREAVSRGRAALATIKALVNGDKARLPLGSIPSGQFMSGGFGLAPVSDWDRRREAMRFVLSCLDEDVMPAATRSVRFETVADIFEAVASCDMRDWYSLSRFLGHPAAEHCRPIANAFRGMAQAVLTGHREAYAKLMEFVLDAYAGEMIESFNGIASGQPYQPEEGLVYIAWSSASGRAIQIGVADGTVEPELRALDSERGNNGRHGLLGTWLVHDVDHARDTLSGLLRHGLSPDGSYSLSPGEARQIISRGLTQSDNLVLSPWHDDNDTTPRQAPALALG